MAYTYSSNFIGPLPQGAVRQTPVQTAISRSNSIAGTPVSNPGASLVQPGAVSGTNTGSVPSTPVATTQYAPGTVGPFPNPSPSGGVGGNSGDNNSNPQSSGSSEQDQLQAQLDAIFNPLMSTLNQQESTARSDYAPIPGQIQDNATNSIQSLTDQQASGNRQIDQTATEAGTRKEDALTSATRLYNELQRGGQQRFGGASSAGEAYQTLTATEQQRRQGTIQSAYETAMQQVGTLKANLQDKYATAVKEVNLQKDQYLAQAQSDFQHTLDAINASRNTAQSEKAQGAMSALQNLRNQVYQVNMQTQQYLQQAALNHDATQKQVDDFSKQWSSALNSGSTAILGMGNTMNNTANSTSLGIGSAPTSTPTVQTGQIASPVPGYHVDPVTGQLVPD